MFVSAISMAWWDIIGNHGLNSADTPAPTDQAAAEPDTPAANASLEATQPSALNSVKTGRPFFANQGQLDDEVRFHVEGASHTVLFAPDAVVFHRRGLDEETTLTSQIRLRFVGAEPSPRLEGFDLLPGVGTSTGGPILRRGSLACGAMAASASSGSTGAST